MPKPNTKVAQGILAGDHFPICLTISSGLDPQLKCRAMSVHRLPPGGHCHRY